MRIIKIQDLSVNKEEIDYTNVKEGEYLKWKNGDILVVKTPFTKVFEIDDDYKNDKIFTIDTSEKTIKQFLKEIYNCVLNTQNVKQVIKDGILKRVKKRKEIEIKQVEEDFKAYIYKQKRSLKEIEFNTVVNEIFGNTEFGNESLEQDSDELYKPVVYLIARMLMKIKGEWFYLKNGKKYLVPTFEILQIEMSVTSETEN